MPAIIRLSLLLATVLVAFLNVGQNAAAVSSGSGSSAARLQRRDAAADAVKGGGSSAVGQTEVLVTAYIHEALVSLRELMRVGIPELGVAPLEPVRLDNTTIDSKRTGAHVKANFTNMTLFGISTMEIRLASVDLTRRFVDLQISFRNWTVLGDYNMTGHLVKFIPIYGTGPFYLEATDVVVVGNATLDRQANGSLVARDMRLDLSVSDVKSHFHKLNGGGAVSSLANSMLSFLSESIFNNSKATLVAKLKATLEASLNRRLNAINVPPLPPAISTTSSPKTGK